ncbi:MAG: F0F1 ATP synthase subunit delta [Candidatus Omnitrophica bacterium]|nr:F0F1 ATP synthase subunit delta [Candidatus Omnitrophota bacterium]
MILPTILILVLVQVIFALIVIAVLKKHLSKELMRACLEAFESSKMLEEIKEIKVLTAGPLNIEAKGHLERIRQRKFSQALFSYHENREIQGGIVIAAGEVFLDFSLTSRMRHFWPWKS